jgi:hypothetical protein
MYLEEEAIQENLLDQAELELFLTKWKKMKLTGVEECQENLSNSNLRHNQINSRGKEQQKKR